MDDGRREEEAHRCRREVVNKAVMAGSQEKGREQQGASEQGGH